VERNFSTFSCYQICNFRLGDCRFCINQLHCQIQSVALAHALVFGGVRLMHTLFQVNKINILYKNLLILSVILLLTSGSLIPCISAIVLSQMHFFPSPNPPNTMGISFPIKFCFPFTVKSFIPISPFSTFLHAYCQELKREQLFRTAGKDFMTKSSYVKMWDSIRQKMNAPSLTAYIFRHNYCTNQCYQIPVISIKKIAELLGDHEKMVIEVYNHILLEKEDAEKAVKQAFDF